MARLEKELDAVEAALSTGDVAAALEHALGAWRAGKQPELVPLVDALGKIAAERERRLDTGKEPTEQKRWLARAAEGRPASLPLLLDQLLGNGPRVASTRLAALERAPSDPRLSRALVQWIHAPPFFSVRRMQFLPTVLVVLEAQKDRQALPYLRPFIAPRNRDAVVHNLGVSQLARLRKLVAALEAEPLPAPLSVSQLARVEACLTRVATMRAAPKHTVASELLAEVYARPDEDEPRLVYADALAEIGDPRGEFIVLQCERARAGGAPSRRERELLKRFERAWLGTLERVMLKSGVRYERGFVAACRYKSGDSNYTVGAPGWATVVDLDVEAQSAFPPGSRGLILEPHLRSLLRVRGMQIDDLAAVARHPLPLTWDFVSVRMWWSQEDALLAVLRTGIATLPRLSGFGTTRQPLSSDFWARALATPTLATVGQIEALVEGQHFADTWHALSQAPALRSATLNMEDDVVRVVRGEQGSLSLVVHLVGPVEGRIARLASALGAFEPGSVASVELVADEGKIDGASIERGRYRASLAPLFDAARRLGVEART
jgi:uncharacterized protein (TIGR02996 family)